MSGVRSLNPNAESMGSKAALFMNINAASGLQDVMKTNLGPRGTIKMLVSGSGDIKLTKDGNVLLREMQIQNPTAIMIARTAVAQDDMTGRAARCRGRIAGLVVHGTLFFSADPSLRSLLLPLSDGTTSAVLLIGELMHQAQRHLAEGLHPRVVCEGFDVARKAALEFAAALKLPALGPDGQPDRELCVCVARTALRTKLAAELADQLTDIVVDAVACVRREGTPLDLHMVEIMAMKHRLESDTRLVRGLVLDHGARHPDMPKHVDDAFVLTCNLSLEYEKSEVNSSFMYSSAEQRERMVSAERAYTDDRVAAVIALKRRVCAGDDAGKGFVFITQKGIDPPALDALAKEGILALRRAKRRNMERLVLACGGVAVDSVTELEPSCLGYAGRVYEHVLGDDAFTFVEEPRHPTSCTVLLKGPSDHALAQMRDAVRDGLRAVKNVYDDGCLLPGAGAFEVALAQRLLNETRRTVPGRAKLGVQAFAEALLVIPKTLAENAGLDVQEAVLALQDAYDAAPGAPVGLDVATGEPLDPVLAGIYDNYAVKVQMLHSAPVIATQLLLVDEVMRAGVNMRK